MLIRTTLSILLFFIPCIGYSQVNQSLTGTEDYKTEVQLSVDFGFSMIGTKSDVEQSMLRSGYGGDFQGWFGRVSYPKTTKKAVWNLHLAIFYKRRSGVMISGGRLEKLSSAGPYQPDVNSSGKPEVNSTVAYFAAQYVYRSKSGRVNYFAGPALVWHKMVFYNDFNILSRDEQMAVKAGLIAGLQINFIHRRTWFLAFRPSFVLSGKSSFKDFTYNDAELKAGDFHTNYLNFTLVAGLRMNGKR